MTQDTQRKPETRRTPGSPGPSASAHSRSAPAPPGRVLPPQPALSSRPARRLSAKTPRRTLTGALVTVLMVGAAGPPGAHAARSVRFLAIGDPQYGNTQEAIADEAAYLLSRKLSQHRDIRGILISGDLTHRGKGSEWKDFATSFQYGNRDYMEQPSYIFEGMGNHDWRGDTDCSDDICSRIVERGFLRNTWPTRVSLSEPHYSWDWDDVHFVQLNIFPANEPKPGSTIDPYDALTFLNADLAALTGDACRPVVLIHHYGFDDFSRDWWTKDQRRAYWDAIRGHNVVAIFTGHVHVDPSWRNHLHLGRWGWDSPFFDPSKHATTRSIPAFNAAASHLRTYLDVQILDREMIVRRLSTSGQEYDRALIRLDQPDPTGQTSCHNLPRRRAFTPPELPHTLDHLKPPTQHQAACARSPVSGALQVKEFPLYCPEAAQTHSTDGGWQGYETRVGDLNGDGRDDILWNFSSGQDSRIWVGMGRQDGTFDLCSGAVGCHNSRCCIEPPYPGSPGNGNRWEAGYERFLEDVDGNGIDDMVWVKARQNGELEICTALSDPNKIITANTTAFEPYHSLDSPTCVRDSSTNWAGYEVLAARLHVPNAHGHQQVSLILNKRFSSTLNIVRIASWVPGGGGGFTLNTNLNSSNYPRDNTLVQGAARQLPYDWSLYELSVLDYTGDGRDDLVFNNRTSTDIQGKATNTIVAADYTGSKQFRLRNLQTHAKRGWDLYDTLTGDVDGDGKDEIIWNVTATGIANRTYVATYKYAPIPDPVFEFLPHQDRPEMGWNPYVTLVGDVNRDGRADLIWNTAGLSHNRTYVAIGNEDTTFSFLSYQDHRLGNGSDWRNYRQLLGDVDGDGRVDIIWNSRGTRNHLYRGLFNF